jgi:hypothetical protein
MTAVAPCLDVCKLQERRRTVCSRRSWCCGANASDATCRPSYVSGNAQGGQNTYSYNVTEKGRQHNNKLLKTNKNSNMVAVVCCFLFLISVLTLLRKQHQHIEADSHTTHHSTTHLSPSPLTLFHNIDCSPLPILIWIQRQCLQTISDESMQFPTACAIAALH